MARGVGWYTDYDKEVHKMAKPSMNCRQLDSRQSVASARSITGYLDARRRVFKGMGMPRT